MMKARYAEYSLYDIPELEETEFAFATSARPRFEDANDIGCIGDSISIAMEVGDGFSMFDV
jgi:hypothetical protein